MNDDEVIINGGIEGKAKPSTVVKKLIDMVEGGLTLEGAAKTMGLDKAVAKNQELKDQFQKLLLEASFSPEIARAVVRSSRLKILGDALAHGLSSVTPDGKQCPPDVGMLKIALEADKQIASDPEVGLTQAPQVSVNINFEKSRDLIDRTEPVLASVEWEDENADRPEGNAEDPSENDVPVPEVLLGSDEPVGPGNDAPEVASEIGEA